MICFAIKDCVNRCWLSLFVSSESFRNVLLLYSLILRPLLPPTGILVFSPAQGTLVPNPDRQMTYALLAIMWELRDNIPESISMGLMLPDIYEEFSEVRKLVVTMISGVDLLLDLLVV